MNAPIGTLAFAERFEGTGFSHEQARPLATAFGRAQDSAREGLVSKADLDLRLTESEGRFTKQLGDVEMRLTKQLGEIEVRLNKQMSEMEVRLTLHSGEIGKGVNNRLWSTVTIIAGVSTTISAVVGAATALLLRSGTL